MDKRDIPEVNAEVRIHELEGGLLESNVLRVEVIRTTRVEGRDDYVKKDSIVFDVTKELVARTIRRYASGAEG